MHLLEIKASEPTCFEMAVTASFMAVGLASAVAEYKALLYLQMAERIFARLAIVCLMVDALLSVLHL